MMRWPAKKTWIGIGAVLLVAAAIPAGILGTRRVRALLVTSPHLAIRDLSVTGTRRLDPEEVALRSGIDRGSNLLLASPANAEARLGLDPWIDSVDVRRAIPPAVTIRIREREPIALAYDGAWVGVARDGVVLPLDGIGESFDLPILTGCGAPAGGESAARLDPERLRRGARFLAAVEATRPVLLRDLSELNLADPDDLVAITMGSGTAVRFGAGAFEEKVARLIPVLEDLSGAGRIPATIDLRYDGQAVVRFLELPGEKENDGQA